MCQKNLNMFILEINYLHFRHEFFETSQKSTCKKHSIFSDGSTVPFRFLEPVSVPVPDPKISTVPAPVTVPQKIEKRFRFRLRFQIFLKIRFLGTGFGSTEPLVPGFDA